MVRWDNGNRLLTPSPVRSLVFQAPGILWRLQEDSYTKIRVNPITGAGQCHRANN